MPTVQQEARQDAAALLDSSWNGTLPIDPTIIAESLGVEVYKAQIPGDVSGMIRKEAGRAPQIYIDVDDPLVRRRFTCAHELGHYIRHLNSPNGDDTEMAFIDYRGPLASRGVSDDEMYANAFAAALLMPEDAVRTMHSTGAPSYVLAQQFSVSPEAMGYRLQSLGLK